MRNENCITVKELKEFLNKIPETNSQGEDSEVWIMSGVNLSSPLIEITKLNETDVCLTSKHHEQTERESNDFKKD